MSTDQKRARWFGVLYLMTFITSIPALWFYKPVLDDPVGYIASAGHDKRVLFGVVPGVAADHLQHRHRGRDRPDHVAAASRSCRSAM